MEEKWCDAVPTEAELRADLARDGSWIDVPMMHPITFMVEKNAHKLAIDRPVIREAHGTVRFHEELVLRCIEAIVATSLDRWLAFALWTHAEVARPPLAARLMPHIDLRLRALTMRRLAFAHLLARPETEAALATVKTQCGWRIAETVRNYLY